MHLFIFTTWNSNDYLYKWPCTVGTLSWQGRKRLLTAIAKRNFIRLLLRARTGFYLYGHLAVIHDALKETLGLGKRTRPELFAVFLENPDNADAQMPSVSELKEYWNNVHDELKALFTALPPAEWFMRHNSMTDEDFEKDPSRNRLSVLINRANHVAYHLGQVALVKPVNG